MENCENMINALEEKFNTKNQEVENLKVLIKQMKEDLEKIKGDIKDANEELKKINKTSSMIEDEILKNKNNFKTILD